MRGSLRRMVSAVVVVLALTSCGSTDPAADGVLHVYAAASLRAPFEEIAGEFEAVHPGVSVQLNLAGSSDLAAQIIAGAPAEVFASADTATMEQVAAEGLLASASTTFASNILTIAVTAGNPLGIESLESLTDPDISTVLCAPQVPCGAAAETVQEVSGVRLEPVSEEGSVTDVLGKVSTGQADAGLVYVTDVDAADGAVDGVPFDAAAQAVNTYPIAGTGTGGDPAPLSEDFIDLVLGPLGQDVLSAHGFGKPDQ
ncbi:molybdate ABC transporter substrate-binding protein [Arthrobacter tumbae]|uniref:molybdate ABC transporter substrate-binding protein n=1 Tax=Arthrobacter tumbae TaxID=163874 RepID=UPI0027DB75A7|nr:molybdate ABC transporter substrate-binding protein [Arthrobacter tumbae]MBM7779878.1 molybdate transport system substrate-binding protein [Arthrobacter tumbae]